MKLHIGYIKTASGILDYCLAIFSRDGNLLYSLSESYTSSVGNKFDNILKAISWGIKKCKHLLTYELSKYKDEGLDIYIDSKIVYNWFEKETAPKVYLDKFSDIILDMSLINVPEISVNYIEKVKVLHNKKDVSSETKGVYSVRDLFED